MKPLKLVVPRSRESVLTNACRYGMLTCKSSGLVDIVSPEESTGIDPRIAMNNAITGGTQFYCFADSDIGFTFDTFLRLSKLINDEVKVASAAYEKSFSPVDGFRKGTGNFVAGHWDETPGSIKDAFGSKSFGNHFVDYVGTGCLCVHHSVFEEMLENDLYPYFHYPMIVDSRLPYGKEQGSYDVGFCINCKILGIKILLDCETRVTHG